jgi:hypothetical protein
MGASFSGSIKGACHEETIFCLALALTWETAYAEPTSPPTAGYRARLTVVTDENYPQSARQNPDLKDGDTASQWPRVERVSAMPLSA